MTKTAMPEPLLDLATTASELRSPEVHCDARIAVMPDVEFVVHPEGMMKTETLTSKQGDKVFVYSLNAMPSQLTLDTIEEPLQRRWLTLAARAYRQNRPVLDPLEYALIVPASILDRAENGPPDTSIATTKFSIYLLGAITQREIAERLPALRDW